MPQRTPWSHTFVRFLAGTAAFWGLAGAGQPNRNVDEQSKDLPIGGATADEAMAQYFATNYPDGAYSVDLGPVSNQRSDFMSTIGSTNLIKKQIGEATHYATNNDNGVAGLADDLFDKIDLKKSFNTLTAREKNNVVILWQALQHQIGFVQLDVALTDADQKYMKMFMDIDEAWHDKIAQYKKAPNIQNELIFLPHVLKAAEAISNKGKGLENKIISTDEMYQMVAERVEAGEHIFPISDISENGKIIGVSAVEIFHADPAATEYSLEKLTSPEIKRNPTNLERSNVLTAKLTQVFDIPSSKHNLITALETLCKFLHEQPHRYIEYGEAKVSEMFRAKELEFSTLYRFSKKVKIASEDGKTIDPDVQAFAGLARQLFFGDSSLLESLPQDALQNFLNKHRKVFSGKFFGLFAESFAKTKRGTGYFMQFLRYNHDTPQLNDFRAYEDMAIKLSTTKSAQEAEDIILDIRKIDNDIVGYMGKLAVTQGFLETKLARDNLLQKDRETYKMLKDATELLSAIAFSKLQHDKNNLLGWLYATDRAYHVGVRFGEIRLIQYSQEQNDSLFHKIIEIFCFVAIEPVNYFLGNMPKLAFWKKNEHTVEEPPAANKRKTKKEKKHNRQNGENREKRQPKLFVSTQVAAATSPSNTTTSPDDGVSDAEDNQTPEISHYTKRKSLVELLIASSQKLHTGAALRRIETAATTRISADERFEKFIAEIRKKEEESANKRKEAFEARMDKALAYSGLAKGKAPVKSPELYVCLNAIKATIGDLVKEGQSDATLKLAIFRLYEATQGLYRINRDFPAHKYIRTKGLSLLRHIIAHHYNHSEATYIVQDIKFFADGLKSANMHEDGFKRHYQGPPVNVLSDDIYAKYYRIDHALDEKRNIHWEIEQFVRLTTLFTEAQRSTEDNLCFNIYLIGELLKTADVQTRRENSYIFKLLTPIKDMRNHIAHESTPYSPEKLLAMREQIQAINETLGLSLGIMQNEKAADSGVPRVDQIIFTGLTPGNGGASNVSCSNGKSARNAKSPKP